MKLISDHSLLQLYAHPIFGWALRQSITLRWALLAGWLLLICAATWSVSLKPSQNGLRQMTIELGAARARQDALEQSIASYDSAALRTAQSGYHSVLADFLSVSQIPTLVAALGALSNKLGLHVLEIRPEPPSKQNQADDIELKKVATTHAFHLVAVPIQLTLRGAFEEVMAYLGALAQAEQFLPMQSLQIDLEDQDLLLKLKLLAYLHSEHSEGPPLAHANANADADADADAMNLGLGSSITPLSESTHSIHNPFAADIDQCGETNVVLGKLTSTAVDSLLWIGLLATDGRNVALVANPSGLIAPVAEGDILALEGYRVDSIAPKEMQLSSSDKKSLVWKLRR